MNPLSILLVSFAGWMNRLQQTVIEYLEEELRVLQEQLGICPFSTADQRRGVESLKLPAWSPNLNAHAERFVRTIKESCFDNMILFGESSLREAVSQLVEHCDQERNHQGLENKIIRPEFAEFPAEGSVHPRKMRGGLLNYYYRQAA